MKKKANNKYSIIYAKYSEGEEKKQSDYFIKISSKIEQVTKNYFIHLSDAMTPARWLEIGHLERTGFSGFIDGEIILHENKNILQQDNQRRFLNAINSYTVADDLASGKEVRQYARRLVKAKTKQINTELYDAGDL